MSKDLFVSAATKLGSAASSKPAAGGKAPAPSRDPYANAFSGIENAKVGRDTRLRPGTYWLQVEGHDMEMTERSGHVIFKIRATVLGVIAGMPENTPAEIVAQGENKPGSEVDVAIFKTGNDFFLGDVKRMLANLARIDPDLVTEDLCNQTCRSVMPDGSPLLDDEGQPKYAMGGLIIRVRTWVAMSKEGTPVKNKTGKSFIQNNAFEDRLDLTSAEELEAAAPFIDDNMWAERIQPVIEQAG